MKPYFSVVIPLYNKERYIETTLRSVLKQSYVNFEVIIVNDGSTDRSLDIVKPYKSDTLRIINQDNSGLSAARNTGINASKYNYIAFLDADDLWCEDYLYTISQLISRYTNFHVFATPSALIYSHEASNLNKSDFTTNKVSKIANYFSIKYSLFSYSSIVISKTVFEKVGLFDTSINYGEEEDFNIRCFSDFSLIHYALPKAYYLTGTDGQLTTPNQNSNRSLPDYSKYLTNGNFATLKPYIDFIYFKLVVLYKMERNLKQVKLYKAKINPSNLTLTRKLKYYLPTAFFSPVKYIYLKFKKNYPKMPSI